MPLFVLVVALFIAFSYGARRIRAGEGYRHEGDQPEEEGEPGSSA